MTSTGGGGSHSHPFSGSLSSAAALDRDWETKMAVDFDLGFVDI